MKKTKLLMLPASLITLTPVAILTGCNDASTQIEAYTFKNDSKYFATEIQVDKVYKNQEFSFTFTLADKCFLNENDSYIRCGYEHSVGFNQSPIKIQQEGNKYTITVDKSIVKFDFINIFVSAYKLYDVDTTGSSSEIEFVLAPSALDGDSYKAYLKAPEGKGVDFKNSTIAVGSTTLTPDQYLMFEQEIDEELITVLYIPSYIVRNDIKLNLQVATATTTEIVSRPEYTTLYMSNPVVGNDFYCYFDFDTESYVLDSSKAIVKVGDITLTLDVDYEIDESELGYQYVKINGNKIEANKVISIDIPVVEIFNVYACRYYENPTVAVVGDSFAKAEDNYQFTVIPLNEKTVDWTSAETYVSVGDKKLTYTDQTLEAGKFTVKTDPETQLEIVTIHKDDTIDNLYCHFITK